ncbi:ATP-binding protein [Dongshaea marina]|uniref:ATP-binding protein n=1 Tax=Dongshaea marina TaxID=2047966 RepID=UPI001F48B5B6|nr:ATP-binding protein [Dongshaea marina]
MKFTEQGEVVVTVSVEQSEPDSDLIRFEVRDTGIGISAQAQQRVFESFSQADGATTRQYGGTGLGLSITRELVQMMGGEVGLTSQPGKGSTFWVTAKLPPLSASRNYPPLLDPETQDKPTALIVDNNDTRRQLLGKYLDNWGLEVTHISGTTEALVRLETSRDKLPGFRLVVVDQQSVDPIHWRSRWLSSPQATPGSMVTLVPMNSEPGYGGAATYDSSTLVHKPVRQSELYRALQTVLEPGGLLRMTCHRFLLAYRHRCQLFGDEFCWWMIIRSISWWLRRSCWVSGLMWTLSVVDGRPLMLCHRGGLISC